MACRLRCCAISSAIRALNPAAGRINPEIRYAKSVMDYIFRWLALKFLPRDAQPREDASVQSLNGKEAEKATELASQFSRATHRGASPKRVFIFA